MKKWTFSLKEELLKKLQKKISPLLEILKEIKKKSGSSFLVGGSVRDLYLKSPDAIENTDLDIEVHGLSLDDLQIILSKFGQPNLVGKQFGVIILTNLKEKKIDKQSRSSIKQVEWSIPRYDSIGRKPEVQMNPFMGIKPALHRRDITINAMALNLNLFIESFGREDILNFLEIEDPFYGLRDIEAKTIHPVCTKTFIQDPLRFYRVMQMISRFEFSPSEKMNLVCQKMDLKDVSRERITKEFEKMILKSFNPGLGLLWLEKIQRLKELFPEIYQVKISAFWNRNLKAFNDISLDIANREKILGFKFAVLFCNLDFNLMSKFFSKLSFSKSVQKTAVFISSKLAAFCSDLSCLQLKLLAFDLKKYLSLDSFFNLAKSLNLINIDASNDLCLRAKTLGVLLKAEEPLITGKDLLAFFPPGSELGVNLKKAYKIQLEFGLKNKNEILKKLFKENAN